MLLLRVILESMFCHYQPSCCCCLLLVVVCGCGCGCGGRSFVRVFVCLFFVCLCVVSTVCCALLCRRLCLWCFRRCVLRVVVCSCQMWISFTCWKNELPRKHFPRNFLIDPQRRRPTTIGSRCSFYHKAADWWLRSLASWLFQHIMREQSVQVLGGVWSQGWNLESHRWQGTTRSGASGFILLNTGKRARSRHSKDWQTDIFFLDSTCGGAWPFSVGGVMCLVNSVNERDLGLFDSVNHAWLTFHYSSEGRCV